MASYSLLLFKCKLNRLCLLQWRLTSTSTRYFDVVWANKFVRLKKYPVIQAFMFFRPTMQPMKRQQKPPISFFGRRNSFIFFFFPVVCSLPWMCDFHIFPCFRAFLRWRPRSIFVFPLTLKVYISFQEYFLLPFSLFEKGVCGGGRFTSSRRICCPRPFFFSFHFSICTLGVSTSRFDSNPKKNVDPKSEFICNTCFFWGGERSSKARKGQSIDRRPLFHPLHPSRWRELASFSICAVGWITKGRRLDWFPLLRLTAFLTDPFCALNHVNCSGHKRLNHCP